VNNFRFLDLNEKSTINYKFDLVICNQVIEHLYNLGNAFENLSKLLKPQGLLWITCPANNYRHGSPNFFSAGYSREFLEKNLLSLNFEVLEVGELCNQRVYYFRHLLQIWPTQSQLKYPMISYFGIKGTIFRKVIYNFRILPLRIIISMASKKYKLNSKYAIETYGLFKNLN
jgi:SAM-dependent methyltransferase